MKKKGKKITIIVLVLFAIMQFLPIGQRKTDEAVLSNDFIQVEKPSNEIAQILQTSCYDCHSEATKSTWYSDIAPVSWWLNHHINDGKKHLSFSQWGTYDQERKEHKIEECVELVEEGEMPLSSYTFMHGDAKLDEKKRDLLVSYFKSL